MIDEPSTDIPKEAKPELNWLGVMALASIVYGLLLLLVLAHLDFSPDDCKGYWFFCLEPNAIGDLLAGMFAPLAFFWLVAAVLVQARELKEQRKELELTRDEMKLQRAEFKLNREVAVETKGVIESQAKAADAQARAAESNALAAETQNKILQDQYQAQLRATADQEFSALLDQLNTTLARRINSLVRFHDGDPARNIQMLRLSEVPNERDQSLAAYCNRIIATFPSLRDRATADGFNKMTSNSHASLLHLRMILEVIEKADSPSVPNVLVLKTIRLKEVVEIIDLYLNYEVFG